MDDVSCDKEGSASKHVSSLCKRVKMGPRIRKPTEKAKVTIKDQRTYKRARKKKEQEMGEGAEALPTIQSDLQAHYTHSEPVSSANMEKPEEVEEEHASSPIREV